VQFGRYRLIDRLGQGGMADVYRAVVDGPRGFTRQLVIKRIHKLFAHEREFIGMLGTEARVTALLNHPAIVQVFEFGQVGDELYLAMELAEGPDLGRVLVMAREKGLLMPPGVACWVIGQLADALAYAHTLVGPDGQPLGIIHRDVSPSNIVLNLVGGVKLLDFGIAKAAAHLHDDRTRTGAIKGKVSYLAPEQVDGVPIDHRADQYALGIVFHECLTASRLFKGMIREGSITPPSHLAPGIDPDIDAVVLRMLARAPEDRFADCAQVAQLLAPLARRLNGDALALRNWLGQVGPFPSLAQPIEGEGAIGDVPATGSGRRSLAGGSVTGSVGELLRHKGEGGPGWRGLTLGVGAVLGLFALVLFGIWPLWQRHGATMAPTTPLGPTASAAPPNAAASPLPAGETLLSINGTAGAEVLVDGNLVGMVPLDTRLPRRAGTRHLQVRLEGYHAYVRNIAADSDVKLTATLKPVSTRSHGSSHDAPVVRNPFDR
jgi:hypothetical protein